MEILFVAVVVLAALFLLDRISPVRSCDDSVAEYQAQIQRSMRDHKLKIQILNRMADTRIAEHEALMNRRLRELNLEIQRDNQAAREQAQIWKKQLADSRIELWR
jgi:hypothetical protein